MLKWESILTAVETQKWWVEAGREVWHHIEASYGTIRGLAYGEFTYYMLQTGQLGAD